MPIFKHHILNHRNLYLLGIIIILISLPLSPFGISLGTFIIAGNWLLEGQFSEKYNRLQKKHGILVFASLYFIWIAGLWNTANFGYAFHDLKIKVPLLVLPLLIVTSKPLREKEYRILSILFLLALWAAVIAGLLKKTGFLLSAATDSRDMGVFVSHIRLALMIGTGILIAFDFVCHSRQIRLVLFSVLSVLLFIVFLLLLHSLTALFVLVALFFFIPVYFILQIRNMMLKYFLSVFMITLFLSGFVWISDANGRFYTVESIEPSELDSLTANGNPYIHLLQVQEWENGHYTWLYLCEKELRKEWNRMSINDYDGKDKKGNEIRFTLIRYLTSKGLRKDSAGVHHLTEKDIRAIEAGTANVLYTRSFSLYSYYYKCLWELNRYRRTGDPSGHSIVQRLVYQQTGWKIAKDHFLTGVGTGDVQDEFNRRYKADGIPLERSWWLRAHNQYLTILLTTGIFGLLWFLAAFFLPWLKSGKFDPVTSGFILLASVSMLWEDTLETQAGVYFIVFFYVFFIFAKNTEIKNETGNEV